MKSLTVVLETMVVLVMGFALCPAQVYEFSKPNVPVNDDSLGIREHYLCNQGKHPFRAIGETLYATWVDTRNRPTWAWDIYFSKSTDRGSTWLPNVRVTRDNDTVWGLGPSLAIDTVGYIFVAWAKNEGGSPRVWVSRSTDHGATFQPGVPVGTIGINSGYLPAIEVRGRRVFVSWVIGSSSIWFSQSTNRGQSFLTPTKVNAITNSHSGYPPSLSLGRNGRAYVAWEAPPGPPPHTWAWLAIATDSADTAFLPERLIGDTAGAYQHHQPDIVVKDTVVYCIWIDGRNRMAYGWDIYFAKSIDGGMTFGTNHLVGCSPHVRFLDEGRPSLAVDDSGGVYAVWDDNRTGSQCIFFSYSSTQGDSFGPTVLVTDTSQMGGLYNFNAHMEVAKGRTTPYVLWGVTNNSYFVDIYSARGERVSGIAEFHKGGGDFYRTLKCSPNPFRNRTTVWFQRPSAEAVAAFAVFNCLGQKILERPLTEAERLRGWLEWESRDQGPALPTGVYFCQIGKQAQRVVILH